MSAYKYSFHLISYYLVYSHHAGIIRTALANMDREAREHYTVVIQAKDMAGQVGGLSGSTTINITLTDVNDNPPEFPQSTYTTHMKACSKNKIQAFQFISDPHHHQECTFQDN